MTLGNKFATDVTLLERNRLRGWIAIIREGKGFIEEANMSGNIEPILFTINSFTGDNIQIELGDELEFSVRKISNRLVAENILKVPSTLSTLYVSLLSVISNHRYAAFVFVISLFYQVLIVVVWYHLYD